MSPGPEVNPRTEIRDGMRITHQPRGDVYRPIADGRYPVILSHGIYAKGLSHQEGYPMQWQNSLRDA